MRDTDFSNAVFKNVNLTGAILSNSNLEGVAGLSQEELNKAIWITVPKVSGLTTIKNYNLTNALFGDMGFTEADLAEADMEGIVLTGTNLNGKEFQKAKLDGAFLTRAKLHKAKLNNATLVRADLTDAELIGAELNYADLTGSKVSEGDASGANFQDAQLQCSKLDHVNLSVVKNLQANQLRGCSLYDAALPEYISQDLSDAISKIDDRIKDVGKFFLVMLSACAYTCLTALSISHLKLLLNSSETAMPVIGLPLPMLYFFQLAPGILLGLYIYFHIELQRIWKGIAELPAVFTDGRTIEERLYPWFMISFIHQY